ncbi:MAG: hypothetical protein ABJE95_13205 [Byssovorax sp.]
MSTFTNVITAGYRKNRDRLTPRFPAARDFLLALEQLHEQTDGRFHVGTDQNLHLYLEDRFLAYIRLEKLSSPKPSLVFSPRAHNDHIKDDTRRTPELLCSTPLRDLIEKHRGGSGGWAKREREKGVELFRIEAGATEAFFADLLQVIRAIT